ncbi:hypothetical protein EDB81DRAFT_55461 [Dactylonectria macrodidyma]|uniref:Uncharacterized protein n=1 Tax=Dactylonectria macrodidyma TaxID=307937 RepID=A0A9P9ES31_9HYPO|nr:hypothetical protein EDB81DRAFT_55461 [Dactylonectria macrodidyma]
MAPPEPLGGGHARHAAAIEAECSEGPQNIWPSSELGVSVWSHEAADHVQLSPVEACYGPDGALPPNGMVGRWRIPGRSGEAGPRVCGPKKRQVALWTCCNCGQSGMSMRVDPCVYCSTPRCMYCPVIKVKSKPSAGAARN